MTKKSKGELIGRIFNVIEATPLILPVITVIVGAVSVIFLILEKFAALPIILTSLPLCVVAVFYILKQEPDAADFKKGSQSERRFVGSLVIIGILSWVGFNSLFNSQHVYTNRDPAIYAVAGAWLVDHPSVNIPRIPSLTKLPGVKDTSAGFGVNTNNNKQIYAQGTHILPAFFGLAGRAVGQLRIYPLNVLFGGVALLSFYAFARLLVKPRWALVGMIGLGASLPMLYFSRDSYTEPLALAFTFGALALMVSAYKSSKIGYWLLAGLTLGAGVMARIDAYMAIGFVIPFVVVFLAGSEKNVRARNLRSVGVFIVGLIVTSAIGYLDTKYLSSGYFGDTWSLIRQELMLIVGLAGIGSIVILVSWRSRIVESLDVFTKNWRAWVCIVVLAVGFIGVAARPLVYDEYKNISSVQTDGSKKVERIRSYKEEAVYWVAWYIGPLTMAIGALGILLTTYKLLKQPDVDALSHILLIGLTACTALIYFIKPSIASDQIWASRRMLPVIMPGFIAAAMIMLQYIYEKPSKVLKKYKVDQKILASVLACLIITMPLLISFPFAFSAPFTQLSGVIGTCNALPKNSTVLWMGSAHQQAPMSTRAFCGVDSVGLSDKSGLVSAAESLNNRNLLKEYYRVVARGGRVPVIGLFDGNLSEQQPYENNFSLVADGSFNNIEYIKGQPPRKVVDETRFIRLAIVKPDGTLKQL